MNQRIIWILYPYHIHNDVDELISDKAITHNRKKDKYNSQLDLSENLNAELFKQFKQCILFLKVIQHNQ